jgi:hypothetical protein
MEPLKSPESNTSNPSNPKFFYIPETHFITMSLVTLGLFNTYWVYKNWSYLKERDNLEIMPFWRAVFGIFYMHSLLKEIGNDEQLNRLQSANFPASNLATGWVVMNILGNSIARSENISYSSIGIVISLSSFLFLLPVQNYIHNVNKIGNRNLSYSEWSFGQTLCIMLGAPLLIFVLIGVFLS